MKYLSTSFTITPASETASDVLCALLADVGYETFMPTDTGLDAWIQETYYDEAVVSSAINSFPIEGIRISFSTQQAPDEDWNAQWEQEGFQPILIEEDGKLVVVVHDTCHKEISESTYDIIIHPRQAFGTGSHQTTRMILRQLSHMNLTGLDIVDAGTGTGVLSIMCAKRGANSIFAYDIDEWSVYNTRDNLCLNNINNVQVALGDSRLLSFDHTPSSFNPCPTNLKLKQPKTYSLLIANINRNVLLGDLPRFISVLKEGGKLLLSGFYHNDVPILVKCAESLGMKLIEETNDGEWAMLLLEMSGCKN